jgi:hypothetical protein
MPTVADLLMDSLQHRFSAIKQLGEKALARASEADLQWTPDPETNSIATIVKHLHGNMLSRWTDFLTSDGEKPWRDRDGEFDATVPLTQREVTERWDAGWARFFETFNALTPDALVREVTERGQTLSVIDALNRQLSHYAYHIGQIVWIAKLRRGNSWNTLSIARGQSKMYRPTKRD